MAADPVLVLQLHRLGDLLLTFPLLRWLRKKWSSHPVWVVAEPHFFSGLMPFAPDVVFFPPSHCHVLAQGQYAAAINLSSNQQAADCMAQLRAEQKWGPIAAGENRHIRGYWHLYRAALTHNNRNNPFHWADLHLLDMVSPEDIAAMQRVLPRPTGTGRVGLVLGASEKAKRPDAQFWIRLARHLQKAGVRPLFLGGEAERELGEEVGRKSGLNAANFCGKLSLREVGSLMRTLDLCITPDTGPMHLADHLGTPVLNLSMGPVHARETGPSAPGQWVLRAGMSCVGCWQCAREHLFCKRAFRPAAVARAVLALLDNPAGNALPAAHIAGLRLLRTERDSMGLHALVPRLPEESPTCRAALEDLWQAVFLFLHKAAYLPLLHSRVQRLHREFPLLSRKLVTGLHSLCASCAGHIRRGSPLPADFWRTQPPLLRLFSGHMHMTLQNTGYSPQGWQDALRSLGALAAVFPKA